MSDSLDERVRRIYAVLENTGPMQVATIPAIPMSGGGLRYDMTGGLSPEEAANLAHSAIHNVASLRDHLRGWARRHKKDPDLVDRAIDGSLSLQIVMDLWDREKHGPPHHGKGYSGRRPKLDWIDGVLEIRAGPPNSFSGVTFTHDGSPGVVSGDVSRVITGSIVDGEGKPLGDLRTRLTEALAVWERLLAEMSDKQDG